MWGSCCCGISVSGPPWIVQVRGFSKVLGCQSWRLGYVVSSAETVALLMKLADPIYICIPFLQHAMGDYLTNHFKDFTEHKAAVGDLICKYFFWLAWIHDRNWELLSVALKESLGWEPIQPAGSMYGMCLLCWQWYSRSRNVFSQECIWHGGSQKSFGERSWSLSRFDVFCRNAGSDWVSHKFFLRHKLVTSEFIVELVRKRHKKFLKI